MSSENPAPQISEAQKPEAAKSPKNRYSDFILVVGILGAIAAFFWFAESTVVSVQCKDIEGGMACTITTKKGAVNNANVCWEIYQVCSNGQKAIAKRCHSAPVENGASEQSLLARSEFSGYETCDKPIASSIENITVSLK